MDTKLSNKALEEIKKTIDNAQKIIAENKKRKQENVDAKLGDVLTELKSKSNFILQGGAGSGKTETLKQVIEYISETYPKKKLLCITHTNNAVAELKSRLHDANSYEVSTIHSFLNKLIKQYKKNIKKNIFQLFVIEELEEKTNYDSYKKIYERYAKQLFRIKKEQFSKYPMKKEFDANAAFYISSLNKSIGMLNLEIKKQIDEREKDKAACTYNETRFNQWRNLSFGHDGLLDIASILIRRYPLLKKIICDSYDFVLIDEYQDTNQKIMEVFIEVASSVDNSLVLGLFGDSMQGIYEDGIGDVKQYIDNKDLTEIKKEDNFRCSEQVIKFINTLRNDELKQEVALKEGEKVTDRQGAACLYYKLVGQKKPHVRSEPEEKNAYLESLNQFISEVRADDDKVLMLTNKSIAKELGFEDLYKIFDDRFVEVKDEIEGELASLQFFELLELYDYYNKKKYAPIYDALRKSGFSLKSVEDKNRIKRLFSHFSKDKLSAFQALNFAFEEKLLLKSESYEFYMDRMSSFKNNLEENEEYKDFKKNYDLGGDTLKRFNENTSSLLTKEKFDELESLLKQERYYAALFAEELQFIELVNYYKYAQDETQYITMHKTKGSGIENVLIVLDEYFWNNYSFKSIYDPGVPDTNKRLKNQKLFYVACSRAKKNLKIVRFVEDRDEVDLLEKYFSKDVIKEISV